jgi:hypothetical protein
MIYLETAPHLSMGEAEEPQINTSDNELLVGDDLMCDRVKDQDAVSGRKTKMQSKTISTSWLRLCSDLRQGAPGAKASPRHY